MPTTKPKLIDTLAFWTPLVLALAVVAWVLASLGLSHPLALGITLMMAAFLLLGVLELRQLRGDTQALAARLQALETAPAELDAWLADLPAGLRVAVRARIEGSRAALPGPALTPYLVGLLVLLGMVGTFLGMVLTLQGTGAALEGAVDLQAMRDSLATPVKGLGLAFGTSVAGVAASAALGLMSALARRERLQASQTLDARIAGPLRPHTPAHRQDQAWTALARQTEWLPALVDRLDALSGRLDAQTRQTHEQLLAQQRSLLDEARARHDDLAQSVGQSLREHVGEGARRVAETVQPLVASTLAGLAGEGRDLQRHLGASLAQQAERQTRDLEELTRRLHQGWSEAESRQNQTQIEQAQALALALSGLRENFESQTRRLAEELGAHHQRGLEAWSRQQAELAASVAAGWQIASSAQAQQLETHTAAWQSTLARTADAFQQQAAALVQTVHQSQAELNQRLDEGEATRQTRWAQALEEQSGRLHATWKEAGERTQAQQQAICQTLETTAQRIATEAEAHARGTLDEIGRLLQGAAEAPRLAAELVQELRGKLSDSLARDTAMLEERSSILSTLQGLLGTVQQASTRQKDAIDALMDSAARWLDQAQAGLSERYTADGERLQHSSNQLEASAEQLAGLSATFGAAVDRFGQTAGQLAEQLARIEQGLERSGSRSDEQLAYYVTQARELLDLSVMSQQRVIEDLRRLGAVPRADSPAEA